MGLISFTTLVQGATANAADVNTPLTTIYNEFNGNIADANVSATAAIAFSKIAGGSSTALAAWAAWTPTWTNLTIGNATQTAKYVQTGKTVNFRIDIVLGTTTTVGTSPNFTLPVTSTSLPGTATTQPLGLVRNFDTSATATYLGYVFWNSTTTGIPQYHVVGGGATVISSSSYTASLPYVWATGDEIHIVGTYEAV